MALLQDCLCLLNKICKFIFRSQLFKKLLRNYLGMVKVIKRVKNEPISAPQIPACSGSVESALVKKLLLALNFTFSSDCILKPFQLFIVNQSFLFVKFYHLWILLITSIVDEASNQRLLFD